VARLELDNLGETDFEKFCFELLIKLGFVNVDWRKGTGLSSSPADQGRDIEAELEHTDVDGTRRLEKWFVDAKHYVRGVPPTAVQGLLAWAHAERPQVALVIASSFLSNPTKAYLREYEQNNRPPFRIKYWERPTLEKLLSDDLRGQEEIVAAEQEFFDRIWYGRHLALRHAWESGERDAPGDVRRVAIEAAERVKRRRPDLGPPVDDFEWGVWSGKLSALRWVLGEEWDFLDT
jgi:hypothetical protein